MIKNIKKSTIVYGFLNAAIISGWAWFGITYFDVLTLHVPRIISLFGIILCYILSIIFVIGFGASTSSTDRR